VSPSLNQEELEQARQLRTLLELGEGIDPNVGLELALAYQHLRRVRREKQRLLQGCDITQFLDWGRNCKTTLSPLEALQRLSRYERRAFTTLKNAANQIARRSRKQS
jgi:hypothetical protein